MSTTLNRRAFLGAAAAPLLAKPAEGARPNFLWLTYEDIGPHFHCNGDAYSVTPNMDRLAQRGCVYDNVWSTAPVCAPARTAMITGLYPAATGAEHMRSQTRLPAGLKMYPAYLREAGYYCVNNGKEDYNLEKPEGTWDRSWEFGLAASRPSVAAAPAPRPAGNAPAGHPLGAPIDPAHGHWRDRAAGQPFLAVFNDAITHESGIFGALKNEHLVHDPALAWLAAFEPDLPEVRREWAQYHDLLTQADARYQVRLDELAADGLLEDTIIVVTSDHGCGMARYKRMPYDSGLHVPLILVIPDKFRHLAPRDYVPGGHSDRLVSTVDFGPTMLSLAGVRPPEYQQGRAFAGRYAAAPRAYLHGGRARMDERHDLMRSTRDKRYVYIRNYDPHRIYAQHVDYAWSLPSTPIWERLHNDGKLQPPQTYFWETKPPEELYDLKADPSEVRNLAGTPAHKATLERFRREHRRHELEVRDVSLLPEGEMHARAAGRTPYELGHDERAYPLERVLAAADLATLGQAGAGPQLEKNLTDADSGVRYWGAQGLLIRGSAAVSASLPALRRALEDTSPDVRVSAAEALGRYGAPGDLQASLNVLIAMADCVQSNAYVAIRALNAIDALGSKAAPLKARIEALPIQDPKSPPRVSSEYTRKLVKWLKTTL